MVMVSPRVWSWDGLILGQGAAGPGQPPLGSSPGPGYARPSPSPGRSDVDSIRGWWTGTWPLAGVARLGATVWPVGGSERPGVRRWVSYMRTATAQTAAVRPNLSAITPARMAPRA